MRNQLAFVVVLTACTEQPATHGPVTIDTEPDVRVDFMSGDTVTASTRTDTSGRVTSEIDLGDRAVIVIDGDVIVLDQLEPGQEFRWKLSQPAPPASTSTSVTVTWPMVRNAVAYRVISRCGGTIEASSPAMVTVCADHDAVMINAIHEQGPLLGSYYQQVTSPSPGQSIVIDDPFTFLPARVVSYIATHEPLGRGFGTSRFVTDDGLVYEPDQFPFDFTGGSTLPAVAGTVRTEVRFCLSDKLVETSLDQRTISPVYYSISLHFPGLSDLATAATYDSSTSTLSWSVAREGGGGDAIVFELPTTTGTYTLVTHVEGTIAHVPSLPGDQGLVTATTAIPLLASTSFFEKPTYHATVSLLGSRLDLTRPLQLFLKTLTRDPCEP